MKRALLTYHRADFDGLFSGAIMLLYHQRYLSKQYTLDTIGWDFGDPIVKNKAYDLTILVDLPPDCLENFDGPKTIWIDHHQTAIDKWGDTGPGRRLSGVAACRLCWEYLFDFDLRTVEDFKNRDLPYVEPYSVTLAGEHDVWDHRDENAMAFQYGLNAMYRAWTIEQVLNELIVPIGIDEKKNTIEIAESGKLIQQWQDNYAFDVCESRSYLVDFEGIKFCALASVHARMSTWFPDDAVSSATPSAEGLMCVRLQGDKNVRISLYHREGFNHHDLSKIATKYGGGGHKGACGFELPLEQAVKFGIVS